MEQTPRAKIVTHLWTQPFVRIVLVGVILAAGLGARPVTKPANGSGLPRHTRQYFRHDLAATVRADHPAILPLAAAIREITTEPIEQLVIVNDVAHLLVDYDDDERVWGTDEFHATFDEMLAKRRETGWLYLRDDCDGRAIFAAHLLAALGIPWQLEASYWKEHAWVVARVDGVDYDLLDLRRNAPETDRLSYKLLGRFFVRPSHRPPHFAWRKAWAHRTNRSLSVGLQLGLLAVDSMPGRLRERYATDWTVRAPAGRSSPADDRLASNIAGYPYGEPLFIRSPAIPGLKVEEPMPAAAPGVVVAGSSNETANPRP